MKYEKPDLKLLGPAAEAVRGVKKNSVHPDMGGDISSPAAYEADE